MTEPGPTVVVFRRRLLAWSETFILSQVAHYRRYRPLLAGLERLPDGLPLEGVRTEVAASHGPRAAAAVRWARRVPGWPSAWLRALAREQPRVFHAHFGTDALWALPLARRLRTPLVATFHGYDASALETPERRRYRERLPVLFSGAAAIVAVSEFVADKLRALGCAADRLHVVPLGIDLERFAPAARAAEPATVVFAGRLVEKKGAEHLLRAMPEVLRAVPAARLVVIGDGPLRDAVAALARPLGDRVTLLGRVDVGQVRQWLQRATVLAVPSVTAADGDAEGLPTVVVEAMACGVPVVGTRHAGIPEAVTHEVSGLLCDERDSAGLARALVRVLGDAALRSRLAHGARQAAVERFDQASLVGRLEDLYDRVGGVAR